MTYFRRIRGNIVLAVEKYWTRLRLVQYFSTARTIFPRIHLKAIQYYVIIGAPRQVSKFKSNGITVGDTAIKPSNNVRNLGVFFDTQLNMESQIISVC